MKLYFYLAILTILDIMAIITAKLWYQTHKIWLLLISFLCFGLMAIFFGLSMRYEGSAVVNVIWVVCSTVAITLTGYFLFKETLGWHQIIGIMIVLVGLAIIEWK